MNIMRYLASILCKLGISSVAGAALWLQLNRFGLDAWRLLETWMLALAVVYYLSAAINSWFSRKSGQQLRFCPFVQGTILALSGSIIVFWAFCQSGCLPWPGATNEIAFLSLAIVPALALLDWLIFSQKGSWRAFYPWQWLGLIISFCCVLILTADFLPAGNNFKYPYEFLNYELISIPTMLLFAVLVVVIVLIVGYTLVVVDFVLSGELSRHIVLPRIKTIIVEDEGSESEAKSSVPPVAKSSPTDKPKPQQKPTTTSEPTSSSASSKIAEAAKPAKTEPKVVKINPVSAGKLHRCTAKTNSRSRSKIIADIKQQVGKTHSTPHRKTKR